MEGENSARIDYALADAYDGFCWLDWLVVVWCWDGGCGVDGR